MQENIRRSDGLLNENRQLSYKPLDPQPGRPLLQGQAHHPRGGFHTLMQKEPSLIHARLHRARVLLVCAGLATWDRVSEYSFFGAMARLAPNLGRVPLYEDRWVFDKGGEQETPFPDGFAERNTPIVALAARRSREKRIVGVHPLFRTVMSELRCSSELRDWIRPEVLAVLLEGGDGIARLGVEGQRVLRFIWKAAAIALVLEGEWLTARG